MCTSRIQYLNLLLILQTFLLFQQALFINQPEVNAASKSVRVA